MSNNRYKILIVEDEANILSFIDTILETDDYQVLKASTCRMGQMMVTSYCPDLVILDLGLPDCDGLELIKSTRLISSVPIIVLSARTNESDKVSALDLGANDYITKPFGTAELQARVRAALRNSRNISQRSATPGGEFVIGDLKIDYDKRMVTVAGEEIRLTQTEYNILSFMSGYPGKVLTYSSIIRAIWGGSDSGSIKKLQVNMANIRKKFGSRPGDNRYIVNELGVGYRMNDTE